MIELPVLTRAACYGYYFDVVVLFAGAATAEAVVVEMCDSCEFLLGLLWL